MIWQVDIRNSVKSDLIIAREYHIQPSELKRLPYYQYEWMIEDILEEQKKQEENRKKQEANMPQTPKIPKMSTPSIPKMPKISIPKF